MLTSSTQLQNRSFHVVERRRTSSKCQKMKNARAKRAKILLFIVKYANLWGFRCRRRRRGCLSSLILDELRNEGNSCYCRWARRKSFFCLQLHAVENGPLASWFGANAVTNNIQEKQNDNSKIAPTNAADQFTSPPTYLSLPRYQNISSMIITPLMTSHSFH